MDDDGIDDDRNGVDDDVKDIKLQGPVVRKVDSNIHRIVIFSRAAERHKK